MYFYSGLKTWCRLLIYKSIISKQKAEGCIMLCPCLCMNLTIKTSVARKRPASDNMYKAIFIGDNSVKSALQAVSLWPT